MVEYIDKAEAIEAVNRALDRETLLYSFVRNVAVSALKRLPAANVVPVVRCKYCRYRVDSDKCCYPDGLLCAKNINNPSEYRVLWTIENMILHVQRDFDEND